MRLILAAFALALVFASPAAAKPTVITDPQAFVTGVYDKLHKGGPYQPPEDIYTPRLQALWAGMTADAKDEVGRVDFLFWIDGQDGDISAATVTSVTTEQRTAGDRRVVTAKFQNTGRAEELRFYFQRYKTGWKLDDVEAVKPEPWTLSLLLKYGWAGGN